MLSFYSADSESFLSEEQRRVGFPDASLNLTTVENNPSAAVIDNGIIC